MKKSVFIIFFFSSVLSMSARPNDIGDDARLNKSYKYEGSVSIGYSWAVTLNLETVHGVRFSGSNVFIGGQAGLSYGLPQGLGSYVNVFPRWFFPCSQAGPYRGSSEPPSVTAGRKNYAGGVDLMPEFGLGFKLRNGDAMDLAVRCQFAFGLYDAYRNAGGWLGVEYYPALIVGYRF